MRNDHKPRHADLRDRRKLIEDISRLLVQRKVDGMVVRGEQHGAAVCVGLCHQGGSDIAASAWPVVDHHGPALKRRRQLFGHQSGRRVNGAAWRIWHDDP
jgi:hypothetical protein